MVYVLGLFVGFFGFIENKLVCWNYKYWIVIIVVSNDLILKFSMVENVLLKFNFIKVKVEVVNVRLVVRCIMDVIWICFRLFINFVRLFVRIIVIKVNVIMLMS